MRKPRWAQLAAASGRRIGQLHRPGPRAAASVPAALPRLLAGRPFWGGPFLPVLAAKAGRLPCPALSNSTGLYDVPLELKIRDHPFRSLPFACRCFVQFTPLERLLLLPTTVLLPLRRSFMRLLFAAPQL